MAEHDFGTSGGVELTDDLIEQLIKEAEKGYEPDELKPRSGPGRPPLGAEAASVFHVRLEPRLREALNHAADSESSTPSDVARRALRLYLNLRRGDSVDEGWRRSMHQLASLLVSSVEALHEAGQAYEWQPAPDSAAAQELQHPACGSGAFLSVALARAFVIAADEGMKALADLLVRRTPTAFSTYPVARTAMEALSNAYWLYQPDLGALRRTERGLTVLIAALRQRIDLPGVGEDQVGDALGIVERQASECNINLRRKRGLPSGVAGVRMPTKREFVELLMEDEHLGGWVYWTLSDVTHANVAALLRHLVDDDEEASLRVDESDVRLLVAATLLGWWNATGRLTRLMGWGTDAYAQSARWVDENVASMLEPLRST